MNISDKKKKAGVLMPIFSLPSRYGIGTFGKEAFKFVDFLKKAGQSYWQILPLGPTSFGDSPYSSFSSFALNPYFIDIEFLIKDKLIFNQDIKNLDIKFSNSIDYKWLYDTRYTVLRTAYVNGIKRYRKEFDYFKSSFKCWLDDYALFVSIKKNFNNIDWTNWPDLNIVQRFKGALAKYKKDLSDEIEFNKFIQFLAYRQYQDLKKYANKNGIKIIGDIPIYVPLDSCDVWANQNQFKLNKRLFPTEVSGAPPDQFNENGQFWGNPIYNWNKMKKDKYYWWLNRISGLAVLYDVIRLDHFIGFDSYWSIPSKFNNAKAGSWKKGPGYDFLRIVQKKFKNIDFIAEDLGMKSKSLDDLLKKFNYPGMKVMEFAFDSNVNNEYLPHNFIYDCVSYIGTHDNSTCLGYLKSLDKKTLKYVKEYCKLNKKDGYVWGMIKVGMESVSKLFVVQLQDYLNLGDEARINTPGTVGKNWLWRANKGSYNNKLANKIYKLTKNSSRI